VNDREIQWIALSPDGTRLAAAVLHGELNESKKSKQNVSEVMVWDLNTSAKVSSPKNTRVRFSYLLFSADGKTLIAVDEGEGFAGHHGLHTRKGYEAWDATTGRAIGSRIAPAGLGEFTTAAVSPDGKYLATVFNARFTKDVVPSGSYLVRELAVWDLQAHQVKWKLPGATHTGKVTWEDALAFSPDGGRLAFAIRGGRNGPSSESTTKAHPDQPDANLSKLKMLTLDEGKQEPAVAVLEMVVPLKGRTLQWLSGGKFLVSLGGPLFEVRDPATGKLKAEFHLGFPPPKQPKAAGKTVPLGKPSPDEGPAPEDWYGVQSALSADGSRLAAHFYHKFRDKVKDWQNWVVVWDVRNRKVLGVVALPDTPRPPPGLSSSNRSLDIRIALSGDGSRLAIGGPRDAVGVFDISMIKGVVKATP
jgi:hypothetical protein